MDAIFGFSMKIWERNVYIAMTYSGGKVLLICVMNILEHNLFITNLLSDGKYTAEKEEYSYQNLERETLYRNSNGQTFQIETWNSIGQLNKICQIGKGGKQNDLNASDRGNFILKDKGFDYVLWIKKVFWLFTTNNEGLRS